MFWMECATVLACIVLGARSSGIGIGLAGGLGLAILVFVFHLRPTSPPVDVMLIIVAVISMVSTMQAAGGLDCMVLLAEKLLRRRPSMITFVAPLVTYIFTILCGTAYVAFALYPVIAEIAYDADVRPERPLSIATAAASQAVTASPLSAATAVLVALVSPHGVTFGQILLVCIPAGFIGVLAGALSVFRRGLELQQDPEFRRRLAAGEIDPPRKPQAYTITGRAKLSLLLFAGAVIGMVVLGSFPQLLPSFTDAGRTTTLSIPQALEIVMLSFAFVTMQALGIRPAAIIGSPIFVHGMMAVIAIFGIAWMVDTFFAANDAFLVSVAGQLVQGHPQLFGLVLMATAALVLSQGAAMRAVGPLGLALGVTAGHLVGFFHAASTIEIIPGTGAVVGCVAFDRTGTTKIGRFVFNHSFLLPNVVCSATSVIAAYTIASFVI